MPEENLNLEGNLGAVDFSTENTPPTEDRSIQPQDINNQNIDNQAANNQIIQTDPLQNTQIDNLNTNNIIGNTVNSNENIGISNFDNLEFDSSPYGSMPINNNVFLDSGYNSQTVAHPTRDSEGIGRYLRLFFWSAIIAFVGLAALALLYTFNVYITKASLDKPDVEYVEYVNGYKDKLGKIKNFIGLNNVDNYQTPDINDKDVKLKVNEIINATDIDFIEKKDLLHPFVSELIRDSELGAGQIEIIKQDIAKQGFLPEEINNILSEEQAIDTIQRSLNALEVIKFSTASKVFSYMDSALATISEMVRVAGSSVEAINNLLNQVNERGEKDISAYVYMCYLNPFETNANCDTIGDLDLYYNSIIKDDSLNIRLFKNTMNAVNQILEKDDSALFSITFNGFQAQDKDIAFKIEVYTNQNDERSLIAKGKKNPNIFILTNIINLLKQSSFIIGGEIFTKEIKVDTKTLKLGGLSTKVNYSNMDFTVPIQKSTEREIFDYIDLDNIQKLLESLKDKSGEEPLATNSEAIENDNNIDEADSDENTELNKSEDNEIDASNIGSEEEAELQEKNIGNGTEEYEINNDDATNNEENNENN